MFILKVVKVLCFDTLSQVFILKGLTGVTFCIAGLRSEEFWIVKRVNKERAGSGTEYRKQLTRLSCKPRRQSGDWRSRAHRAKIDMRGACFGRRLRRTGWSANFMSHDSTKLAYCQEEYILGELLVRTDWEVVGGARVTPCGVTKGGGQELKPDGLRAFAGDGSREGVQFRQIVRYRWAGQRSSCGSPGGLLNLCAGESAD